MSKSNLLKDRTKSIVTTIVVGFIDVSGVQNAVPETGASIYIIPRKAIARLDRVVWTVQVELDPVDMEIQYAIMRFGPELDPLQLTRIQFAQNAIVSIQQAWRAVTAVGIVKTSETHEINLKGVEISRRSNKPSDDAYSIVTAYRADQNTTLGQNGSMFIEEELFQDIFKDAADEWTGYTFEESAS